MNYYNNAAKGAASMAKEDYAGCQLQTAQPFTGAILETLAYLSTEIIETDFALTAIQDRIFGDSQVCGTDDVQKQPYSMEAQILCFMQDLLIRARAVRSKSQSINTRL